MTIAIGHNNPPPDSVLLLTRLQLEYKALADRTDALLQSVAKAAPEIVSDEQEGRASDFAAQLASHIKTAEAQFEVEKAPIREAGRIVDAYFKNIVDPIVFGRKAVLAKLTVYKDAKLTRERLAREAAARAAQEAADKAAAEAKTEADVERAIELETAAVKAAEIPTAAELTRSRGSLGGMSGLRTTPEYEIVNLDELPRTYLMVNDAAIKAAVKASPKDAEGLPVLKIPGVRIYLKRTATGR